MTNLTPPPKIIIPPVIGVGVPSKPSVNVISPVSSPSIKPPANLLSKPLPIAITQPGVVPIVAEKAKAEDIIDDNIKSGHARIEALIAESETKQAELVKLFKSKTILTKARKDLLEEKFMDYADINLAIINEAMNVIFDDLGNYQKFDTLDKARTLDEQYAKRNEELNQLKLEQAKIVLKHTAEIKELQNEVAVLEAKKAELQASDRKK
jgi:hypothetical protein